LGICTAHLSRNFVENVALWDVDVLWWISNSLLRFPLRERRAVQFFPCCVDRRICRSLRGMGG
jgi:hypothetical protein